MTPGLPCTKPGCLRTAKVRGLCRNCYAVAYARKEFIADRGKGPRQKYVSPDLILDCIEQEGKPCGLNKLTLRLFGYDTGMHSGLQQAVTELLAAKKIIKIPWYRGWGYIINKEAEAGMQYIISATVPQKDGNVKNQIETDLKPRAIHLANVFISNGWKSVNIQVGGQSYVAPFGDLP